MSKTLELWAGTPANNDKPAPLGAKEGMPARLQNDTQRHLMANILEWFNQFHSIKTKSDDYAVTSDDWGSLIVCADSLAVFLPAIASTIESFPVVVLLAGASDKTVTLMPNGSDTINGAASDSLTEPYSAVFLVNDGTEWAKMDFPHGKTKMIVPDFGDWSGNVAGATPIFPWSSPSKLSDPGSLPANDSYNGAFSPNGEFYAVGHDDSPYVAIYQIIGNEFFKLANPGTLPTGRVNGLAWSPDSQFLACAHQVSPFITIYQRSGTTFTKLANPATLPGGVGVDCAFSPNGEYLCVAHYTGTLTIYQSSGAATPTFTKQTNPSGLSGDGSSVEWSPNGEHFAVSTEIFGSTADSLYVIERQGLTSFSVIQTSTLPNSSGKIASTAKLSWSPDARHIAVAMAFTTSDSNAVHLRMFTRNGSDYTTTTDVDTNGAEAVAVAFSSDGKLACCLQADPYILIFDYGTWRQIAEPASLPAWSAQGVAWSPDGQFLAVAHQNTPYITIYQTSGAMLREAIAYFNGRYKAGT